MNDKSKEQLFQVLLLDNTADLEVRVHETVKVNFSKVKEHLQNGGSVFITSRKAQKLLMKKSGKTQQSYSASRRNYGALIQKTYQKQQLV